MASNGGPPPHGRDHASNGGSNGSNNTADNSNTTTSNNPATPYVPARSASRPSAARPPTTAERAQFNDFRFPCESFESLDRELHSRLPINNQRLPIYRQRPLSEQPTPFDTWARVGGASPAPLSTGVNGVVGGEGQGQGQGQGKQSAARRQPDPYGSLGPGRANATAEDVQRRADIRARADAIVDSAMAGRTTIDSGSGCERARQREGEEEHRRRQDAQVSGAGAGVEDEHAEDKE
ncbi:hypothetical protein IWX90DRAFT_475460 [Phyllosticta citrichinensis]|uniref:Uncharacterized protein n=1 Tax=Phyllosticta citrichinensis TaxID=1130410 RepID=A0ABR1Y3C2_9PEZI